VCFGSDSSPPYPPTDRRGSPIAGAAGAEQLTLRAADGAEFSAARAATPAPAITGVVILPDVRGLYRFYVELAERFAEVGYSAIAIDYFGRTAGTGERPPDFDFFSHLTMVTPGMVQRDLVVAGNSLRESGGVERVVAVGFCFGGAQACLAGTRTDLGLDGVVSFYGILNARRGKLAFLDSPLDRVHEQRLPLLGIYGGADRLIPPEDIAEFDAGLARAGVAHELVSYPGAPHSFFDRKQADHAESCADAWSRVLAFLADRSVRARAGSRRSAR
jgi:carboxymethylenebutenolidase